MKSTYKSLFTITICTFIFSHFNTIAQQKEGFIIMADSVPLKNLMLIEARQQNNMKFIRQLVNEGDTIYYRPWEIIGYGFTDGNEYQRMELSINGRTELMFVEVLAKGKLTLYYHIDKKGKQRFFIQERHGELQLLPEGKEYRAFLLGLSDDKINRSGQLEISKRNKQSLSKLISFYNHSLDKTLPYTRFGLEAGPFISRITPAQQSMTHPFSTTIDLTRTFRFNFDSPATGMRLGVFTEIPIFMSHYSAHIGLSYLEANYHSELIANDFDQEATLDTKMIQMPFLLKYIHPSYKFRPFVNTGTTYRQMLKNRMNLTVTRKDDDSMRTSEARVESILADQTASISIGGGVLYHIKARKTVSAEVRYDLFLGTNKYDYSRVSQLDFILSFSL